MDNVYEIMYAMMCRKKKNITEPIRQATYFIQMTAMLVNMFEYDFGDDDIDPVWLERYLVSSGGVIIGQKAGKMYVAEYPGRTDQLDQYGDGQTGIGYTKNGIQIMGEVDDNTVIGYNNCMRSPDLDLLYYPAALAAVDESIDKNIEFSKWAPILNSFDSVAQAAIEKHLAELQAGKPISILSENVLASLKSGSSGNGVLSVELTDPNRIRNEQYLSELWDVLLRRFCNMNGMDTRKTSKHAQVSVEEATGMDAVSWVLPLDKLRCRQRMIEQSNKIFGKSYSVRFAEPWRTQWDNYINPEMGVEENADTDEDEESVDDPADPGTGTDQP